MTQTNEDPAKTEPTSTQASGSNEFPFKASLLFPYKQPSDFCAVMTGVPVEPDTMYVGMQIGFGEISSLVDWGLDGFLYFQRLQDEFFHTDIFILPSVQKFQHYTQHMIKYAGYIAHVLEGKDHLEKVRKPVLTICADVMAITLCLMNLFKMNPSQGELVREGAPKTVQEFLDILVRANGTLASGVLSFRGDAFTDHPDLPAIKDAIKDIYYSCAYFTAYGGYGVFDVYLNRIFNVVQPKHPLYRFLDRRMKLTLKQAGMMLPKHIVAEPMEG